MVRAAKGRQVKPTSECAAKKRAGMGDYTVIRGFLTGILWGGVVAGAGLAVMSQVAPLPQPLQQAAPAAEPEPAEATVAAPEPAPEPEPAPAPAPAEEPAEPAEPAAETAEPAPPPQDLQPEILQKVPDPEPAAPVVDLPAAAPEPAPATPPEAVMDSAPEPPVPPTAPEGIAPLPPQDSEQKLALAPTDLPARPTPDAAPGSADAPPPPPPPEPADKLLQPAAPAPEPMADPVAPIQILPDEPAENPVVDAQPEPNAPEPNVLVPDSDPLEKSVPGVTIDRLPRIGDAEDPATSMAEGEAPAEILPDEAVTGVTPLELFARPFENPDGKPLFAILLIDDGLHPEERARLAALPFPVTFGLDPLSPESAEAARVYRAAGQEVAMLASGIPAGATAADMEQTFQALDMALPEAVVVLDRREGGFQDRLDLSRQAVPIVAEQGRGLVTYDRGLNSADQVARREGVPRSTIFRILDAEGESIPKMRNYLDRAAFKAAQEGRVVVIGTARAETVAAILEWTVEGRAASVALAPISAVLVKEPGN